MELLTEKINQGRVFSNDESFYTNAQEIAILPDIYVKTRILKFLRILIC